DDALITAEGLFSADARDESLIVSVGGAASVAKGSAGVGVGVGVGVNTLTTDTAVRITGTDIVANAGLQVAANSDADIWSAAISVGAGKIGVAGAVSANIVTATTEATMSGAAGALASADIAGGASFTATDTGSIWSIGGAFGGGTKAAAGAGTSGNTIVSSVTAGLAYVD